MQTRTFTYLTLGVAAGILSSKLVPMFASARAARMARNGGDPFDQLRDDHREILRLLDDMVQAPQDAQLRRNKLLFQLKRRLAMHALAEEDVVYPANYGSHEQETEHLYNEHAEMKRILYALEQEIRSDQLWREKSEFLRNMIREHAQEEEQHVFPQLRRDMQQDRLPVISSGIAREEAMVR